MAPRAAPGFTYIAMLLAVALFGLGLAAMGQTWSAAAQRDKEEELIAVGSAYVKAIGAYYTRSPGAAKAFPMRLEELLEDNRFVGTMRHLRRAVGDPMNKGKPWALVHGPDGAIRGVVSLSEKRTLRQRPLAIPHGQPLVGTRYSEWKFVYEANQ